MADEKELVIKLKLDKTPADQATREFVAAQKKAAQEILSDAEVAEKAKLELIRRTNQQRIQEAARATKTATELAKEAAKDAADAEKKAEKEKTEAAREAAKEKIRLAKEAAKAAKDAKAEEVRATREAATAQKQAAQESYKAEQEKWSGTISAIGGAKSALNSFAVQMIGIQGLSSVASTIIDHFTAVKQTAFDAAQMVNDYREALLELAALKGQMGDTGKTMQQDIVFRAKTGQTAEASRAFQTAALGAGESFIDANGIQKNISPAEAETARLLGGKYQATIGGSADTHGRLVGMMPSLMGGRVTGEQVFAKERQLYDIFQPGGAEFSPMVDQYLNNAPLVTSGLISAERSAALHSAFSTSNKTSFGANVQQFARSTVGGLGRMKGSQIEGDHEKQAEYLKRIGATDQMDMIQIGDLISKDLETQEAGSAAKGEKFNPYTYMQRRGYQSIEDIGVLLNYHGLKKSGVLDKTFLPLAEKAIDPAEAAKALDTAQKNNPVIEARKASLTDELAKISLGAGKEESVLAMKRIAFNSLKANPNEEITDTFEESQSRWYLDPKEIIYRQRQRTENEAKRLLTGEAKRLGIDADHLKDAQGNPLKDAKGEGVSWFGDSDTFIFELQKRIREKGGDAIPGVDVQVKAADTQLQAANTFYKGAEMIRDAMGNVKNLPPGAKGQAGVPPAGPR